MSSSFDQCSDAVRRLDAAIRVLEPIVRTIETAPLPEREWYELLHRKLLPQLGEDSFLVVAVVGGTNIGKSVIFNHIAGDRISSTSPMASGTKHPTAIIPDGFAESVALGELFPGFDIRDWIDPDQPLQEDDQHLLFWRENEATADNLIVLDTPDVDSVALVNWERADHIRQSADVLIAVLTQQKYNDAAVKKFFRKAAQEDKLVIVVFNQCLLPEDEQYWPLWLGTFCEETGTRPHAVFIAPNDRRAAESNGLPFYERRWPTEAGDAPLLESGEAATSLMEQLSQLRFGEIKIRTLHGALQHLIHQERGVPSWLTEIRQRSHQFQEALDLMSAQRLVEIERWPTLPNRVVISMIRQWWADQREGWSANVHGFYNRVGEAIAYPFKLLRGGTSDAAQSLLQTYRRSEWEAVLQVLERTLDRLTWLRDLGNPLLGPRLERILSGTSRAALIEKVRRDHEDVDFEQGLRGLIDEELASFKEDSPRYYRMFRRIDDAAAAARPAVSVMLFMTGAGPVGDLVAPVIADSAMQGVLHVAGDAVGGTVATTVGDKVITEGASTGAGYLEAQFRKLHTRFAQQRAGWMASQLETHLFQSLPSELTAAAEIGSREEVRNVQRAADELRTLIGQLAMPTEQHTPAGK